MKIKLIIALLFWSFNLKSQLFTFKNINHKSGLSLSSILSISQDQDGNILLGTDGFGIQKFNGESAQTFKMDNVNNEHHVCYIDPQKNQLLFAAKYTGYFQFKENKLKQICISNKKYGENLVIKQFGEFICTINQRKISVFKNEKIVSELPLKKNISAIKQVLSFGAGIIVLCEKEAYFIDNLGILNLNEKLFKSEILFIPEACTFYNYKFTFYESDKIYRTTVILNKYGKIKSVVKTNLEEIQGHRFKKVYSKNDKLIAFDESNNLFRLEHHKFIYIPQNTFKENIEFEALLIDKNNDFWATTSNAGAFKIFREAFTKVNTHKVYINPLISFIYKDENNTVILSDFNNKTFINSYSSPDFKKVDLRIYSKAFINGLAIFGTNKGFYTLKKSKLIPYKLLEENKKIIFVFAFKNFIFYSPEGEGLWRYDVTKKIKLQIPLPKNTNYVYTAQLNEDTTKLYYGTNNGLFEFDLTTAQNKSLNSKIKLNSSYSGVSCIDSYGTIWFSLDKNLVSIQRSGEISSISQKEYFNSTLFYNLNSDNFGNLIIGTNLGVTKLTVDKNAKVLKSVHYSTQNGFDGYETHMRSNFKVGDIIYIGTIEGLFSINTKVLESFPKPTKPIIFNLKNNYLKNTEDGLISVHFAAINPKQKGIKYSYRLLGKTNNWSALSSNSSAVFPNLNDDEYTFQLRSTYDGIHFSDISNCMIEIRSPFWKSKWFILFLILAVAISNLILLDRTKNFELNKLIKNQRVEINPKVRSILLGFGFIVNLGLLIFSLNIDIDNSFFILLYYIILLILLILFLISITENRFQNIKPFLLHTALIIIVSQAFLGAYLSGLNPGFTFLLALSTAIVPFIFSKIAEVLLYSSLKLISTLSIIFILENSLANEIVFLSVIIISISLIIFISYIRNESLQKLIFLTELIQKGDLFAIAYNSSGQINYISENCFDEFKFNSTSFLGKNLDTLNEIFEPRFNIENSDFTTNFQEKRNYIFPLKGTRDTIIWIEWSMKTISNTMSVLLGHDVTDKINIKHYYEALVEKAHDLIYFVDINGNFVYLNSNFQKILAYDKSELLNRDSLTFVADSDKTRVKNYYENQFKEKIAHTYFEFKIRKKNGDEIWVGQHSTLLFEIGSEKMIKGFLCVVRDISEKHMKQKLIENQNVKLESSANYAQKIQNNLLPSKTKVETIFSVFSIFYTAKDIVSGDFYWVEEIKGKKIIILSDATGHGVPGSFMSLLGINLLNEIIRENSVLNPSSILSEFDSKITQLLNNDNNFNDGFELTIIVFDKKNKTYEYACAGGKFICQYGSDFILYQGESKHIGDISTANFKNYYTYKLNDNKPDSIYLFTDGIQNQLSETTFKKFSMRRLLDTLNKNPELSIEQQVEEVKLKFHKWKGNSSQTDDVTFIGLKI